MRNNQQTQNYQTTKPSSSTEIIPSYNSTLGSYNLFALQWGCGWNHWNTDNFSVSSYTPCLLLDKDKLSHSSLRQDHKTVIYNVIRVVLAKVLFIQNTHGTEVLKLPPSHLNKAAWRVQILLLITWSQSAVKIHPRQEQCSWASSHQYVTVCYYMVG